VQNAEVIRPDASYLITGGLGALGLKTAAWLIEKGAKHLVLAGRSAPREEARGLIDGWKQRGVNVLVVQADLSQAAGVTRLLAEIRVKLPPLKGIIHAAGVLDDGVLVNQDWPRFERVLAPKALAAWHLHQQTGEAGLDFFVMYSSMASLQCLSGWLGLASPGPGSGGYEHQLGTVGRGRHGRYPQRCRPAPLDGTGHHPDPRPRRLPPPGPTPPPTHHLTTGRCSPRLAAMDAQEVEVRTVRPSCR
jgi:hypothetical protein